MALLHISYLVTCTTDWFGLVDLFYVLVSMISAIYRRSFTFLNPHPSNWDPSGPHVYVLCEIFVNNNHIPS